MTSLTVLVLPNMFVAAACSAGFGNGPWYETTLIGMEVGPSGAQWGSDARDVAYCSRFDGEAIVEKQLELGSEYLVLWARDHEWAYYDSKLMPKCPGLGKRDPLREAAKAAKAHGLPLIAYCVVQAGGHALREHPEWHMVAVDGTAIDGRVCLNSPYYDFVCSLLEEMLAYGVDGFHVDMLDQGFGPPYGCWCGNCRKRFADQFPDKEMPGAVSWDAAWDNMLEFRYETSARFERNLREFVRAKAPGVSVDFNYHGYPPFSFEVGQRPVQHACIGDFVTCETGVWGFSPLAVGLTAEFARASAPNRRYQIVMQRGVRFYHDQTTRPLTDLLWEMCALLMHGAQVTVVDKTPFEGQLDPVAYGRLAEVFREVYRKRDHFGQSPVYDVGLFYSHRTRDWYARDQKELYQSAFYGAHKALIYNHFTTGVLLDENLDGETVRRFPVVIIPSAAVLSDREVEIFTDYVRDGGKLIVTGNSGCCDWYGVPQGCSSLAPLVGARLVRLITDFDNYVEFCGPFDGVPRLFTRIPPDWPHLVYGPAVVYEPISAQPFGWLRAPVRTRRQLDGKEGVSFPSPAGERIGPAVLWNRVGDGCVLTFAVSPCSASGGEYRNVEARTLLSSAVEALLTDRVISVDAPAFVETVVTRDADGTYRVHFAGYLAPPNSTDPKRPWAIPELIVDTPLYRARVRSGRPVRTARALSPRTELHRTSNSVELTINDVHEVLILEVE